MSGGGTVATATGEGLPSTGVGGCSPTLRSRQRAAGGTPGSPLQRAARSAWGAGALAPLIPPPMGGLLVSSRERSYQQSDPCRMLFPRFLTCFFLFFASAQRAGARVRIMRARLYVGLWITGNQFSLFPSLFSLFPSLSPFFRVPSTISLLLFWGELC